MDTDKKPSPKKKPPLPPDIKIPILDNREVINELMDKFSKMELNSKDNKHLSDKKYDRKMLKSNAPTFTRSNRLGRRSIENENSKIKKKLLKLLNADYNKMDMHEKKEKLEEIRTNFEKLTGKPVLLSRDKRKNSSPYENHKQKKTRAGRIWKRSNKTKKEYNIRFL